MPTNRAEGVPPPPEPTGPPEAWQHIELYRAVRKSIYTLPSRFESDLVISGVLATDLFAFNQSLGTTIEEQVVASLNRLRSVWDLEPQYALYNFERQPQTFPDVVLKAAAPDVEPQILLGIELKGWYVLAKEREPSFRYKVTPAVCAPADLLVVVPWALSNIVSGSPKVFTPFVTGARYAAEYRNWFWEYGKGGNGSNAVDISTVASHYPAKSDMISDRPVSDRGGNFGRLARTGVMDTYIAELFKNALAGVPLAAWQKFLSLFTESRPSEDISNALNRLAKTIAEQTDPKLSEDDREALRMKFSEISQILGGRGN
ncbi:MAG: hypothetical protein ACE5KF_00480 [Kiloniellaceae bacterium]